MVVMLSRALFPIAVTYGASTTIGDSQEHLTRYLKKEDAVSDLFGFRVVRPSIDEGASKLKKHAPIVLKVPIRYRGLVSLFFRAARASGAFLRKVPASMAKFFGRRQLIAASRRLRKRSNRARRAAFYRRRSRTKAQLRDSLQAWVEWSRRTVFAPEVLSYFELATTGLLNSKKNPSLARKLPFYRIGKRARRVRWQLGFVFGQVASIRTLLTRPTFNLFLHEAFRMTRPRFMSKHNFMSLRWVGPEPFINPESKKELFRGYSKARARTLRLLPMLAYCQ